MIVWIGALLALVASTGWLAYRVGYARGRASRWPRDVVRRIRLYEDPTPRIPIVRIDG